MEDLTAFVGRPKLVAVPLTGAIGDGCGPLDWESNLTRLLESGPQLLAARAVVERNQAAVARERAEPVPNVIVRAGSYYDFDMRQAVGTAQVGVRLPVWDRNQGNIQTAQGDLLRSEAKLNRLGLSM